MSARLRLFALDNCYAYGVAAAESRLLFDKVAFAQAVALGPIYHRFTVRAPNAPTTQLPTPPILVLHQGYHRASSSNPCANFLAGRQPVLRRGLFDAGPAAAQSCRPQATTPNSQPDAWCNRGWRGWPPVRP